MSGKLIVIDGIDGSGKATQTKLLVEKLRSLGFEVETMDFPQYDNNFFGRMVRNYLDGKFGPATEVNPYLASLLYAADRWESSSIIHQWLESEKIVILDRYYTSNLIHQTPKLSDELVVEYKDWLEKLEFDVFKIPRPNLVLYLHVNAEAAYDLIAKRGNGHDGLDQIEYMKKAEEKCLKLASDAGWKKVECCSAGQIISIPEIERKVWQEVKDFLAID